VTFDVYYKLKRLLHFEKDGKRAKIEWLKKGGKKVPVHLLEEVIVEGSGELVGGFGRT
jgi:hypothetical protein